MMPVSLVLPVVMSVPMPVFAFVMAMAVTSRRVVVLDDDMTTLNRAVLSIPLRMAVVPVRVISVAVTIVTGIDGGTDGGADAGADQSAIATAQLGTQSTSYGTSQGAAERGVCAQISRHRRCRQQQGEQHRQNESVHGTFLIAWSRRFVL